MYVKASVSSKSGYMMAALGSIIIISSIISTIRISIISSINCNMLSNIVIIAIIVIIRNIVIVNTSDFQWRLEEASLIIVKTSSLPHHR